MRYITGYYQQQREGLARIVESGGRAIATDLAIYSYLNSQAAYQTATQRGLTVDRGQVFTTRAELARELHLKDNAVRDSLKRLESLGLISVMAQDCIRQRDQDKGPGGGTLITVVNYGISEGDKTAGDQDKGPGEDEKPPENTPGKGPGEAPGNTTPGSVEAQGLRDFGKTTADDKGTRNTDDKGTRPLSSDKLITQLRIKAALIDKGGYGGGRQLYGVHENISLTGDELRNFLDTYTPEALDLISERYHDMEQKRPANFKYHSANFKYCCDFMARQTGINQYMWDFDNHYFDLLPPDMTYQQKQLEAYMQQHDDLDDEEDEAEEEDQEAAAAREAAEREEAARRAEEERQNMEAWRERIEADRIRREAGKSTPLPPIRSEAPSQEPPDEASFRAELDEIIASMTESTYTVKEIENAGRAVKEEYLREKRGDLRRLVMIELAKELAKLG